MTKLVIMGGRSYLQMALSRFPQVEVRGGHTVYETETEGQEQLADDIHQYLTTVAGFSALDTTDPQAPVRVTSFDPSSQTEITYIPQQAGG
jgi:hypothetical protein